MTDFEKCKKAYDKGWTDAEQLKIWVVRLKITPEEYKTITNIDYFTGQQ